MKNLWTIIKKELKRFFTDKRMLLSLVLPGILIFVVYSVMGETMTNQLGPQEGETYQFKVENEPDGFTFALEGFTIEYVEDVSYEQALVQIEKKELDLYVIYPVGFLDAVANDEKPEVIIHFNSASPKSSLITSMYQEILRTSFQTFTFAETNHATVNDTSIMIITSLVPFLLITFLFSGAMAVAPESIAGEKERGTIANLLITPVKRSTIALGKILALSIVAMTSAASSFLGLMFSLPKLMGGADMNFNMYGPVTYLLLLLVIVSTVLLFIVLISLVSTYAKSIKEATSLSMPLMIIVMLAGASTLMGSAITSTGLYFIPIYNSVNAMLSIFSLDLNMLNFGITILTNLVISGLGVFLLTKMFNSEKIMFRK